MVDVNGEQDVSAQGVATQLTNQPERLSWYQDQALGMYLYWTVDASLGMVNAHSVIGASKDYLDRYFTELPRYFYPKQFDADWYARLAKLCGFDYVTICAKNHNGFCAWDTKTCDFNVMQTPYGKDLMRVMVDAIRGQGLPVSVYFSPDDAWFQWKRGQPPNRRGDTYRPDRNPELLAYACRQLDEILERYEPDMMCFDGFEGSERPLAEYVWKKRPRTMITRGGIPTPEQALKEEFAGKPFEAHFTIGKQWQYRSMPDQNKTARELIDLLIQIRSQGGTLLLAAGGPDADGLLPRDKDSLLREMGVWNFVNREAVRGVRPCPVQQEDQVRFTRSKDGKAVYVFDLNPPFKQKEWTRTLRLASLKAVVERPTIEVLGHGGEIREYSNHRPDATITQTDTGLEVTFHRAQRLTNDWSWQNPRVLKLTGVRFVAEPVNIQATGRSGIP